MYMEVFELRDRHVRDILKSTASTLLLSATYPKVYRVSPMLKAKVLLIVML